MNSQFSRAIVRPPSHNFAGGLTTVSLGVPSHELASEQHRAYCEALKTCGLALIELDPDDRHPDATFVEDTAVIIDTDAVLTRPGAPERSGEAEAIRQPLESVFGKLQEIVAPGTVDGGDVCEAGDRIFIGRSLRTNLEGARQLASIVEGFGKRATIVDITDMRTILHFKSGMAYIEDGTYVVIDELLPRLDLEGASVVRTLPEEDYAANCIRVNDTVLIASGYPAFESELKRRGFKTLALDMSEYRKMDGGLSCLSLRF